MSLFRLLVFIPGLKMPQIFVLIRLVTLAKWVVSLDIKKSIYRDIYKDKQDYKAGLQCV